MKDKDLRHGTKIASVEVQRVGLTALRAGQGFGMPQEDP
jgi:hypothetical protein